MNTPASLFESLSDDMFKPSNFATEYNYRVKQLAQNLETDCTLLQHDCDEKIDRNTQQIESKACSVEKQGSSNVEANGSKNFEADMPLEVNIAEFSSLQESLQKSRGDVHRLTKILFEYGKRIVILMNKGLEKDEKIASLRSASSAFENLENSLRKELKERNNLIVQRSVQCKMLNGYYNDNEKQMQEIEEKREEYEEAKGKLINTKMHYENSKDMAVRWKMRYKRMVKTNRKAVDAIQELRDILRKEGLLSGSMESALVKYTKPVNLILSDGGNESDSNIAA